LIGNIILIGSTLISTFFTNFYAFMLFFSVGQGVGASTLYVLPVKVGWAHFPEKKGIVSGIIIGAFGLGSFLFNVISTQLMNPDGVKPDANHLVPKEVYD